MKNSKLTNKEIKTSLDVIYNALQKLSNNDQVVHDKTFQIETLFILYLKWKNEEEKFSKFVKEDLEKIEQSRLQDKEGA